MISRPFATANARRNRRRRRWTSSTSCATARRSASSLPRAPSCIARCARWSARWCGSARDAGVPTIWRARSKRAAAPPAARWRRRTDFTWCGWTIEPRSREVTLQHATVNLRQLLQIGNRRTFVDLVHGLADQPELDHRTVMRDEARIRGPAAGVEGRFSPGDLLDCRHHQVGESTGFCQEYAGIGWLPHDARADAVTARLC